jgi:mannose/fructose-specific phosphotransferase system component IIA
LIVVHLLIADLPRERREHRVFTKLLQMFPGMEERIMSSSEEEVTFIVDLVGAPTSTVHLSVHETA